MTGPIRIMPDPRAEVSRAPGPQRLRSPEEVGGIELPDLSDFFNPFLRTFMEGTLGSGGEVAVVRGPSGIEGVALYHEPERLVSVFTRSSAVAVALIGERTGVDVFCELPLTPGFEVFHIYAAEFGTWDATHRFSHPVREARASDRPALVAVLRELYGRVDEGWFRPIPPLPDKGFVVEVEGGLAAAGWVTLAQGHARLHTLSVRSRYRRLGVGTDLWYARMLWARAQGATSALLEVSEHNRVSREIAATGGMQRVGQMYRIHRPGSAEGR